MMIDFPSSQISSKIKKSGKLFIDKLKNNFVFTLGSIILIISGLNDIGSGKTSYVKQRGYGGNATYNTNFDVNAYNTSKLINAFGSTKIAVGLLLLGKKKDWNLLL